MGCADSKLHPVQSAAAQGSPEVCPERLGSLRPDAQIHDLPAAFGVGRHGDFGRNRHDAPTLVLLEVCGIQRDIGPVAGQGALQELAYAVVDIFAQLRDSAFGSSRQANGLHQIFDIAGRDAAAPSLLNDGNQCLLVGFARLENAWGIAALPQLGQLQVQRAEARVEHAVASAVVATRPISTCSSGIGRRRCARLCWRSYPCRLQR